MYLPMSISDVRRQVQRRRLGHREVEDRRQHGDGRDQREAGPCRRDRGSVPTASWPSSYALSAARPVCGNRPRGRRWMKRISATSTRILPSTAPAYGSSSLFDDAERHAADERAPEVADAAEDHHHERVDDVGLPEVGPDVGELAERDARDAGDPGAQAEGHRVDPVAADADGARHRPVLRHGADLEPEPRALAAPAAAARTRSSVNATM